MIKWVACAVVISFLGLGWGWLCLDVGDHVARDWEERVVGIVSACFVSVVIGGIGVLLYYNIWGH